MNWKQILQMKKIFLTIAIFSTVNNFAFSQEEQDTVKEKNYTVAVHIHPISFVWSLTTPLNSHKNYSSLAIYSTIEIPCSPSISFIIRPSLINSEYDYNKISHTAVSSSGTNEFRLGTDLGVRYYTNNNGKGFYVQGTVGLFRSIEEKYNTEYHQITTNSKSFFDADIMGYIGTSIKPKKTNLTIFFDVGIGFGNRAIPVFFELTRSRFDINFGLGYKF